MQTLKIVTAQINTLVGDVERNTQHVIEVTKQAIEVHQAELVIFPEMTLSGYPPEDLVFRRDFLQACLSGVKKIEEAKLPTTIIIGFPYQGELRVHNQAAVISHGKLIVSYSKQELPNYTVFDEKRYFHPGNRSSVFQLKGFSIGLVICEDLWFPGPAAQCVQSGAQLIIVINASPFDKNKAEVREEILMTRIKEVKVPIIYTNLVGGQDELVFDGGSMVFNHLGERCQQADYFFEQLLPISISLQDNTVHIAPQPLPPRFSEEENIYRALVMGVRDYIQKNHFPGAIVGLSGGIDSALTLAIAVDAIGPDQVEAVLMPSRYTSTMSKEDAIEECRKLGVRYRILEIEPAFEAFLKILSESFKNLPADTTEENLQARIRGTLLMALSNKQGSIVLTTGNKSEMSVGYATLYGDMAGGFCVLKDVFKTMVYRLAKYRNAFSAIIPQRVIERPPSAELALNQCDQDTLPPYPLLDQILFRYIELDQSPEMIYATGIDKNIVNKVIKMIIRNEYKRRQAPVGIRITQRAFGKDWRYPITSGWRL